MVRNLQPKIMLQLSLIDPKGAISMLIVTRTSPDSPSGAHILRKIRKYNNAAGLSIHMLHLEPDAAQSPNLYINLARLMAKTEWVLMSPGNSSRFIQRELSIGLAGLELQVGRESHILTSGPSSYPFQPLSPLLIRRDHTFWCTERVFLDASRALDWDECLWQLSLDANGRIDSLRLPDDEEIIRGQPIPEASIFCLTNE